MHRHRFIRCLLPPLCLLIGACGTQVSRYQSSVLEPAATATYKNSVVTDELHCSGEQGSMPPTVEESDLGEAEIGTGFRNWMRREEECARNHAIELQGLVSFAAASLPPPEELVIQKAELRFYTRPLPLGPNPASPDPADSFEETIFPGECPVMKLPAENWQPGFHHVSERARPVQTKTLPDVEPYPLNFPAERMHTIDVSDLIRQFVQERRPSYEFAFQSDSDLLYGINDMYCLMIVGGFELTLVYDRVK